MGDLGSNKLGDRKACVVNASGEIANNREEVVVQPCHLQ